MKTTTTTLATRAALASLALLLAACAHTASMQQTFVRPVPARAVQNAKAGGDLDDMSLAASALQNGDPSLAATLFEKATDKRPGDADAFDGLGAALALTGDLERARHSYERAMALAPDSVTPLIGLARLDIRERRLDDAIALYDRVLDRDRGNALASAGLGTAYALEGDEQRAQNIFGQALQLHPGERMLTVDLGLAMVLGGELRKGANLLLTVAGEPSAPAQARHDLALAYGLLGNDGAADRILMRDLPRASTDDDLAYYKVVRARLDAPPGATPIAALPPSRHIGVRQITLGAASPIEPPAALPVARAALDKPVTQAAALDLAHVPPPSVPHMPHVPHVPPIEAAEPSAVTAPASQWQLHGQTPLLQLH